MSHKTERGVFELKQGRILCVTDGEGKPCTLVAAVEALGDETLERLRSLGARLRLVITAHRGRAMGIGALNGDSDLGLALDDNETPETVLELSTDPGTGRSGRELDMDERPATRGESAAMALTRFGRILPAVVAVEVDPDSPVLKGWIDDASILEVSSDEVTGSVARSEIEITRVAEAPVPLAGAEKSHFVFFREGGGFQEHVAVLIGPRDGWPDPVPVRLHSACLTGDLFGSLRCDCGEQLRGSLEHFKTRGGGVLVYLAQEGRGIGLGNKIRAYGLQESGLDTVDADGVLGFGADERRYDTAVEILRHLGIPRVELLTNNPEKVAAVEEGGIEVITRTPIYGGINQHNLRYVQSKVDRSGHWLMDMISQPVSAD